MEYTEDVCRLLRSTSWRGARLTLKYVEIFCRTFNALRRSFSRDFELTCASFSKAWYRLACWRKSISEKTRSGTVLRYQQQLGFKRQSVPPRRRTWDEAFPFVKIPGPCGGRICQVIKQDATHKGAIFAYCQSLMCNLVGCEIVHQFSTAFLRDFLLSIISGLLRWFAFRLIVLLV